MTATPPQNTPARTDPLLRVEGAIRRFGGVAAVDGLDFAVERGEVFGLIGPNGAGKTTLFDCLAGAQALTAGRILLDGRAVEHLPAHRRAGLGVGRSFQVPRPFGDLSVLDNVMVGAKQQRGEGVLAALVRPGLVRRQEAENRERALRLLDTVSLTRLAHEPARVLSGGQRKLLDLARALIGEPSLLLLDEPAAGVNPSLLEVIVARIRAIRDAGVTVLLIEHNMDVVARLCSRVLVMAQGRRLAEGPPATVTRDRRVVEAYLGRAAA